MFIRATSQRDKKTNREYTSHRLVESYRNQSGKVRQQTLLNLGADYDFPKEQWKPIADRVEEILSNQTSLFELEVQSEKEARRIAKIITKKRAEIPTTEDNEGNVATNTDMQTVDINSLEYEEVRKVGCEYVSHYAAKPRTTIWPSPSSTSLATAPAGAKRPPSAKPWSVPP